MRKNDERREVGRKKEIEREEIEIRRHKRDR
jgi:hypothetical protein